MTQRTFLAGTTDRECYVYIMLPGNTEFVTAGRFQVFPSTNAIPVGRFIYGKKYLAHPDAVELDPLELKLGEFPYETTRMQGFFGAIRDAMPDFWGRRVIEHYLGKNDLDEFDYLLHGPDDRAGALGFGLNVTPPSPRREFSRTLDLAYLQEITDLILRDENTNLPMPDKAQIQALLLEGTSMGGARPKAVIEDNDSLWIAKFSTTTDRWNQPRVEHAVLNLAKACGLRAADSKIVTVANKDVLLVRRFDRDKIDHGYQRYRMISALTLLRSEDHPLAKDSWSYLSLADEMRRISTKPNQDLKELFARMCFNAAISNLDDHPRNHAILAKENWQLSPAYDLTPTITVAQDSRFLAMACGIEGRIANKRNILSAYEEFLLSKEEAEKIIDHIVDTVKHEWRNIFRRTGVSEKDCKTLESAFLYEGFFY